MANTTMTYVTAIDFALTAIGDTNPEVTDKLTALKAQMAKRGSKGKGMTKTQKENEVLKGIFMEILKDAGEFIPVPAVLEDERVPEGLTAPKVGALMRQLIDEGKAVKVKDKKRILYAVKGTEFVAPDAEVAEGEDA